MAARARVGIIYRDNENWIGGTYYIQNLILALKTVPEEQKPQLTIFCATEKEYSQINNLGYPYLEWKQLVILHPRLALHKRIINKLSYVLKGFDVFHQPLSFDTGGCDVVFPAFVGMTNKKIKRIFWIPDFQEQKLPGFFSANEIKNRTQSHRFIARTKHKLVFSSHDAYDTFEKLFPQAQVKKYLLHFAVSHPLSYTKLDGTIVKAKYNIDRPYFFAPNQFWKHKNQQVVLKSVALLKNQGFVNFVIAFSGKEHDYRNPDYTDDLKQFVKEHELEKQVRFLGFIDREEQLKLMSEAIAIIQPSLFEGWSTVVEDAKAMGQWTIASDLAVHKEQLKDNVSFFNPSDEMELAIILKQGIVDGFDKKQQHYNDAIERFGSEFLSIVNDK